MRAAAAVAAACCWLLLSPAPGDSSEATEGVMSTAAAAAAAATAAISPRIQRHLARTLEGSDAHTAQISFTTPTPPPLIPLTDRAARGRLRLRHAAASASCTALARLPDLACVHPMLVGWIRRGDVADGGWPRRRQDDKRLDYAVRREECCVLMVAQVVLRVRVAQAVTARPCPRHASFDSPGARGRWSLA